MNVDAMQKYWVTEKHGNYVNSFMVYAPGLCLCSEHVKVRRPGTQDIQRKCEEMEDCPCVEFKKVIDSLEDGTMVTVAKLKSSILSGYAKVTGKFDLGNLSLEVDYEIDWVIMFEEPEHAEYSIERKPDISQGRQHPRRRRRNKEQNRRKVTAKLECPNNMQGRIFADEVEGATIINTRLNGKEMHEELIIGKRLNEWIRIPGGEFETHLTIEGQIEPALYYEKGMNHLDLVIKGFIVRPKL
ncbi:hypothetical protein KSS87_004341 [Heliosperma pusillum]|nr:hypothetical protein KSS87_004341 [Heliosperma pusillum]